MLTVIRPWLEGRAAPAPAAPPSPPLQTQPQPGAAPLTSSAPKPTAKPVPPSPTAAARNLTGERDERSAPPATGIVGQIDAILQARLVGTALEGRGIYLSNSPQGGVIVNVGLQKFNGIDEVADPEIKAALRSAITEWENKYTPGL
jgi:hypothetical protein